MVPEIKMEDLGFDGINEIGEHNDDVIDYYEEDLADEYLCDFKEQIVERGEEYYDSGNVLEVYKDGNKYYSLVDGNSDEPYNVSIEVTNDGLKYNCDCPCEYLCKHEYATLIAISNLEYTEVKLKEKIKENKVDIKEIIEKIPAEELKEYIKSSISKYGLIIDSDSLSNDFRKYFPQQKYEYYYNNLYNYIVLDKCYEDLVDSYLFKVKKYIDGKVFEEVFNIIKAIINAYNDTGMLNNNEFINKLPMLGMYLRVIYRKADDVVKLDIDNWINDLKQNNYNNNYYLEDMILSIKQK